MVDGEAVLEAVRAAGVLGDVAADGADRLRGRIGRVEVAMRAKHARLRRSIDDAGLDDDLRVGKVHIEDAVHARQADNDAAGQRAAHRRSGPCPAPRATKGILFAWHTRGPLPAPARR